VDHLFNDPRVSYYLLDPIRATFIEGGDHVTDGYRRYENISLLATAQKWPKIVEWFSPKIPSWFSL
jgi:hypothetical protein